MYKYFIPFYGWMIFHYLNIPCVAYSLISWWTFGSFPWFGYSAAMNIHVQVFVWTPVFISLGYTLRSEIAGTQGNSLFKQEWLNCFLQQLHNFTFPPVISPSFSTFSLMLAISHFFCSCSTGCEVVSYYGFDLHLLND